MINAWFLSQNSIYLYTTILAFGTNILQIFI